MDSFFCTGNLPVFTATDDLWHGTRGRLLERDK